MTKRQIGFFILIMVIGITFLGCDLMATLFHGEKPPDTHTVTFNANSATGTPPETQTVNAGTVINLPDKGGLSKGTDIFVGWSESTSGSGTIYAVGASVKVTKDMVFYARWFDVNTPQFTVTYHANGGSGTVPQPQTVYSGISVTIPGKGDLSKSGKIFSGWNTLDTGGGTNYLAGATYTVTANVTLYAKWLSEVQYTVTYHANGGSGAVPQPQTVDPNTEVIVQDQGSLSYTGKKFIGWNSQSNGGGTNYTVGQTFNVTGNITLYAKWQDSYTVTFNANGASGVVPTAQTVDPGTVINLPGQGSMTYLWKTFEGWNTLANGSGTSYAEGEVYTVNANVTLYAKWVSQPDAPQGENPPGSTFIEKLAYVRNNAGDGVVFDIAVDKNEFVGPQTVSTMGRNITLIIRSASSADIKTIQLDGKGYLFSVDANITLKLQNIVLKGHSTNNKALVSVGSGGTLILYQGSKITMNANYDNSSHGFGGGVYVAGGSIELNEGAEISENEIKGENMSYATYGGGIYVTNGGNVNIRGGIISGNKVTNASLAGALGGGIAVFGNSTVTMTGGIISKNTISSGHRQDGGGIYVETGSTFIKRAASGSSTSGIIYGGTGDNANTIGGSGKAVYRNWGTLRSRNTTLGGYDEISTGNDVGWE
ncbi:InlB B-repeat-containing protein [Treponema sp. R80B11-R83G3]